jgi:CRP-like cAMP-binding protein
MVDGEDPKTDAVPEMYQRLLQSDYPGAIALAKKALESNPSDGVAQTVLARAEAELRRDTTPVPSPGGDALELEDLDALSRRIESARPRPEDLEELDPSDLEDDSPAEDTGEMTPLRSITAPTRLVSHGSTAREMARAFLDSDYPRALELARAVLAEAPGDVMAEAIAKECGVMNQLAASIPVRVALWDDRVDANEDAVAASVLSLVDGRTTVAEIAEQSGLAPAEAVRLIEEFVANGVLRLDPAPI